MCSSRDTLLLEPVNCLDDAKAVTYEVRWALQQLDCGNRAGVLSGLGSLGQMLPDRPADCRSDGAVDVREDCGPSCPAQFNNTMSGCRSIAEHKAATESIKGAFFWLQPVSPCHQGAPGLGRTR